MVILRAGMLSSLLSLASPVQAQGVEALFELLCGRSVHFHDEGGNQIEYTAGDGTAYLWYHGIPEVLVGTWGVFDTPGIGPQVCYEYDPGAFGPLDTGGQHCWTEERLFETVIQGGIFEGDRYGLRDGEPPFLLPEQPMQTLESFEDDFPELERERVCGLPIA